MIYDKNENPDPNMDPDLLERQPMLDNLIEEFDGVWIVGFNRKTGEPFVSGSFADAACGDALSFFHGSLANWMAEQREIEKKGRV
jgi:hypothetical protein